MTAAREPLPHPTPLFNAAFPATLGHAPQLMSVPRRTRANPRYTGRGVVIAFLDSGFYSHPDIASRVRCYVDATHQHITEGPHCDHYSPLCWHGQMTSVIAAGDGSSTGNFAGIASGAELVLVKISDAYGRVKEQDILRGLRWVLANHSRHQIRIVNLSVGGDEFDLSPNHALHQAVAALSAAGVVVVAAAGNNPQRPPLPPASAATAITVGGYDDRNSLNTDQWSAYHHSFGQDTSGQRLPHLLAPAVWIPSPLLPETEVAQAAQWLGQLLHLEDSTTLRRLLLQGWSDLGISRQQAMRPNAELLQQLQAQIHQHKLIGPQHQHVDGTSVAAPIVSAVAAQMLEANPALSPLELRALLLDSASPLPQIPAERQGAGVLNAAAAVQAVLSQKRDTHA